MDAGTRAVSREALQAAQERHRRGDLAGAIAAYEAILAGEPTRGDVWHLRALAEHQARQLDQSWASVNRALQEGGEQAATLLLAAMIAQDRGDAGTAEQTYARSALARPGWAPPLANRGQLLLELGRADEALEVLRAAGAIEPLNPRIWNNTALALLHLNRVDEAQRAFEHTLTLSPLATTHFNLARIFNMRNDVARAFEKAQAAVRLDPKLTDAWLLLGDLYRKQRDVDGMRRSFATAVQVAPRHARALNSYAEFLASVGEVREAREQYRRIEAEDPANLFAALGANLTLPQVYRDAADVEAWRGEFDEGLARLEAGRERFKPATPRDAMEQSRWSNFYLAYQGRDDRELQSRFGDFVASVVEPRFPPGIPPVPRAARPKIRVGFCSHFFFNCTAGRYFMSWITRLDKTRFEPYVYYTNEWVGDDTRTIAAAAAKFRHLPSRSFDLVARHILDDELDILVYPELGMHGQTFAMAAWRLAPVQVAGWGHPVTTGQRNIDYFVSCAAMEPEGAQAHYRERLVTLPGLGTHYGLPPVAQAADRATFQLPADANLYLVPQSLFKIHPDNDELLARVIEADRRGQLVVFAAHYDAINTAFHRRLSKAFGSRGLSVDERVIFLPYMTHGEYLRVNASCDVMLDTLHWSGGNTSLDAIASGLPIVTQPGKFMRGRQSAAMLRMAGVDELVVEDSDAYVALATALGNDPARRSDISRRLKEGHGALFSRDEPIRALEEFLATAVLGDLPPVRGEEPPGRGEEPRDVPQSLA